MKFKDLNPTIIELPAPYVFHRVQLIRSRATSLQMNGLSMPPVGLMHGRFCLPNEPVAYLADSQETALYESLLRRETVSRSLSELRRKGLVEFVTTGPLRLEPPTWSAQGEQYASGKPMLTAADGHG